MRSIEATERARLLDVTGYDIRLDLSSAVQPADGHTFNSVTEVRFRCVEPGASTFIEVAAESVRSATLNGTPLDLSDWSAEKGLVVPGLAAENTLLVDADFAYSTSGQGLHRTVDPVDGEQPVAGELRPDLVAAREPMQSERLGERVPRSGVGRVLDLLHGDRHRSSSSVLAVPSLPVAT